MDNFKLAIARIETELDEVRNELKKLEEQPKLPVGPPWYDFTDDQKEHLGEIVDDFIKSWTRNMRSLDVDLSEDGINVNVTLDLQDIIEDALPYDISNKFQEHLEDETTKQREEQRKDCEESQDN